MVAGLVVGYFVGGVGFGLAVMALLVPLTRSLRDRLTIAGFGLVAAVVGVSLAVWAVL